jgi:hypothetical protein
VQVTVANVLYQVRSVPGLVVASDGLDALARADYEARVITISRLLHPRQRLAALAQAVHAAWRHHAGPAEAGDDGRRFALELVRLVEDLWGPDAALQAQEAIAAADDEAMAHAPGDPGASDEGLAALDRPDAI